jgi:hypothetical protein
VADAGAQQGVLRQAEAFALGAQPMARGDLTLSNCSDEIGTPNQPSLPTSGLTRRPGASRWISTATKLDGSSSILPTTANQSAVLARVMNFLRPLTV